MAKTKTTFEKGHAKIDGAGRKSGVPNKVTAEAKHLILMAVDEQSKHFDLTMERIREENPVDWAKIIVKMMDFVLPKQMNINMEGKIINVIPPQKRAE